MLDEKKRAILVLAHVGLLVYSGHMKQTTYRDMYAEGLNPSEVWPRCTLTLTYLDGKTERYTGVRFLAIPGFSDPIEVDGTSVTFETGDDIIHALGVRRYTIEGNV